MEQLEHALTSAKAAGFADQTLLAATQAVLDEVVAQAGATEQLRAALSTQDPAEIEAAMAAAQVCDWPTG